MTTASGLKYADKRIGGGAPVSKGLLLILDYRSGPQQHVLHCAIASCLKTSIM